MPMLKGVGLEDHQIAVDVDDVVRVADALTAGAHVFVFRERSARAGRGASSASSVGSLRLTRRAISVDAWDKCAVQQLPVARETDAQIVRAREDGANGTRPGASNTSGTDTLGGQHARRQTLPRYPHAGGFVRHRSAASNAVEAPPTPVHPHPHQSSPRLGRPASAASLEPDEARTPEPRAREPPYPNENREPHVYPAPGFLRRLDLLRRRLEDPVRPRASSPSSSRIARRCRHR